MVMETPSPQCVGREFVRQYYTLLNEAPLHLHRFYSHNSSFVHGGVEKPGEEQPPVMGQQAIHKKIMSLNFRDCHAKIRQVDSQATVGNAVVVQVTGELSNSGQQMRRFMQTFVLAPQSPKKYYVHNDIFRYQDEVFHDNDTDTENQEDTQDSESEIVEPVGVQQELLTDSQQFYDAHAPPLSNGTGFLEEEQVETPTTPKSEPEEPVEQEEQIPAQIETFEPPKEEPSISLPKAETIQTEEPAPEEPRKAFSWADLASKGTRGPVSQTTSQSTKSASGFGARPEMKQDTSPTAPKEQRAPRGGRDRPDNRGRDRDRVSLTRDDGDGNMDRRGTRFPDSHQLFVGNLPHNVAEKELKTFFEEFGNVVELRINTKSGTGSKVPNFGFVVFDNPDPVQHVLQHKMIIMC
ncbi:GTPase activating protein (SH3 domain) binding protein [Mactra antiquata]